MTKETWGGKGSFGLHFPQHCSLEKKVRAETQTGLDPVSRTWYRGHAWVLLTGFLFVACSACFLVDLGTASPGMAPPTLDWALAHQSLIKKMPYSWILWRHSLNWGSLLSDFSLYQVGIKLSGTLGYVMYQDSVPGVGVGHSKQISTNFKLKLVGQEGHLTWLREQSIRERQSFIKPTLLRVKAQINPSRVNPEQQGASISHFQH